MGQSAAKFTQQIRLVREDNLDVTTVEVDSCYLTEKELRKFGDALRSNR